ncbi:ParB N-terminal domain-containing protein [Staphylococcus borealis]|uniref:ParB N-terminal domain-containing protein n=1 Tax=Staphylococcus borealis TaxID=2742203 RepID=UPI002DBF9131|nr:ParB N-terminal domain-containing protein [Staphylococcus borealis]MEB7460139.1 ParB N-terminal domain-containing protein [Staphylococcus borealis]
MKKINIQEMSINDITPADYNPRIDLNENDDEYKKIKNSIEEFGYVDPIIWNKRTGNIVGGHQRYTVLKDLGYDKVDVSVVDMNEQDEMALNVALNKVEGEWDRNKLKDVIEQLEEDRLMFTGFDEDEIDSLMNDINIDDFFEEEEKAPNREEQDGESKLDTAIELLELVHNKFNDVSDNYKKTDLYQSVEYFLERN